MQSFKKFSGTSSYIASEEVCDAVNVAIALEKPLLVKGEPGTGKTLLAEAISESLGLDLLTWNVKSTSKAQDGLYVYDALQRLNDSRFQDKDVANIDQYIKLGALGKALNSDKKMILLIDEIDKADLEFPNDLLHELDRMNFRISETGKLIKAKERPIVIISSNAEKELPDAFLRRVIFHYIQFPDQALMKQIIKVHHPDLQKKVIDACLEKFYWLRSQDEIRKKPSTSELIDWLAAVDRAEIDTSRLKKEIPFLGTLIKKEEDKNYLNRNPNQPANRFRF